MHTLRPFAAGILVPFLLCPLVASGAGGEKAGSIDSMEQFGEFSQTYYTDPRPDLIPAALTFLNTSPLVSNAARVPMVTMSLSCILHRPELSSRSWAADVAKLEPPARAVVEKAIALEPEALLAETPKSPGRNDLNWACFFGSGEEKYLDNLVSALSDLGERKDRNAYLTAASAQWSLSSNAESHPRVKAKLEQLRAAQGPLQKFAAETLKKSPQQIRADTTALLKDQRERGVW